MAIEPNNSKFSTQDSDAVRLPNSSGNYKSRIVVTLSRQGDPQKANVVKIAGKLSKNETFFDTVKRFFGLYVITKVKIGEGPELTEIVLNVRSVANRLGITKDEVLKKGFSLNDHLNGSNIQFEQLGVNSSEKVDATINEKVTAYSPNQTKGLVSNLWEFISNLSFCLLFSYQIDEKGFKNLGNTCFMNSSIRLFLSKNNIEDLICVSNSNELKPKNLNRREKEGDDDYKARQKLLGDIVSLHLEVKKETSNVNDIEKWLRAIGSNSVFKDRFKFFVNQEDAHEFLSIVMDALEIDDNPSMFLKQHRDLILDAHNKRGLGNDQTLPIVELYSQNQNATNPSSLINKNLEEEVTVTEGTFPCIVSFRHPNLQTLKSLMIRMPRFDAESKKTSTRIQSVFESFNIKVFDEAKKVEVTVKLNPKSAVCHIGSNLNSGHYVVIVKKDGKFFQKSDTLIKELTKQQAESYSEEQVYLVDYDVEVVNEEKI